MTSHVLGLVPRPYRGLLTRASARRALLAGVALRLPGAAMFPTLTLLCVTGLGTSYAAAGLVSAGYTLAAALTAPWLGRLVDRRGVRWVGLRVLPVHLALWLAIGHATYPVVVALAVVAGATGLPFWGISRQLVLHAVPESERSTALSLDSVGTELAYIVGPAAGIALATAWSPEAAITCTGLAITAGIAALVVADPDFQATAASLSGEAGDDGAGRPPLRTPGIPALLVLSVVVSTVLVGTDLLLLAQLRAMQQPRAYAAVAAVWAFGSMLGGLAYGLRTSGLPARRLVVLLCLATVPVALAPSPWLLAVAGFLAGVPCAPVMTAITAEVTALVDPDRRTEALGICASANTTGATLGSTAVGALVDRLGPLLATVVTTATGAVVAVVVPSRARSARRARREPVGD